jgi:predicted RNA-binding Zn ribbon-like protein
MSSGRPEPLFVGGTTGLDFLNSIATPVDVPVEWIVSGDDLLAWLKTARLIPSDVAAGFRKNSLPGELDAVAAQARSLREWFRGFVHAHKGKPLKAGAISELEPLNQLLAREEAFRQIVPRKEREGEGTGSAMRWRELRRWRSPDALLLPIARALADLVCDVNFADIKACEGPACSLLYFDQTRGRVRRWCSMAVCGNRWKQAAHRERAKVHRR